MCAPPDIAAFRAAEAALEEKRQALWICFREYGDGCARSDAAMSNITPKAEHHRRPHRCGN